MVGRCEFGAGLRHEGPVAALSSSLAFLASTKQPACPARPLRAPARLSVCPLPAAQFCYTGGYVEAGLQFPGDDYVSGFCECEF